MQNHTDSEIPYFNIQQPKMDVHLNDIAIKSINTQNMR